MKKSEKIKEKLSKAGYYTSIVLNTQLKRELRYELFEDVYFEKRMEMYEIKKGGQRSFIIHTHRFGVLRFFPIADKVHILSPHKWISGGLAWIDKNLLEPKEYA